MTQQQDPQQKRCCICGDPVSTPYNIIGQRVYCARHFAIVNKPHPGFWRSAIVQIIAMAVFSAGVAFVANQIGQPSFAVRILLGIFLAIVPSLLWLIYFYQQDRLEPEPKTSIALVLMTAFVLTDVLARRVIYDWFHVSDWAPYNTWTSLGASILVQAVMYQLVAYIAIRMIYGSPEMDERMDGIVYGTVAGLGVAAMLNLRYIIGNEGVDLAPGVVRTVTTALASASFSGLLGWFMSEAKFAHKSVWWIPVGFAITTLLNGVFNWLIGEVSASGLSVDPWRSLAFGLVVAVGTFLVLSVLMRRAESDMSRGAAN